MVVVRLLLRVESPGLSSLISGGGHRRRLVVVDVSGTTGSLSGGRTLRTVVNNISKVRMKNMNEKHE
jgi:hypothetical protein